jgi:hypothetical protein
MRTNSEMTSPNESTDTVLTRLLAETMELRVLQARQQANQPATDRVEVEVSVQELLAQGGAMYPVESVTVERAWYFTLPSGGLDVREAT